jgi:trehalose 6-phosphate synthase
MKVNARFADTICSEARPGDSIWVHDYHLMLQGKLLSTHLDRERLSFFHHIPFPPPDVFEKLPWRLEILESLLSFGTLGFQTLRDRRNFLACVKRFLPATPVHRAGLHLSVGQAGQQALVGAFPIGIDFNAFAEMATKPAVVHHTQQVRRNLRNCKIVIGVDRLDYTKGIPERLKAFRSLLSRYPALYGSISLIQVVVPSREDIPKYQELKMEVERLVTEINGHFGRTSWVPVHYQHRHLTREELIAYYCAADIGLITPLKDGMNLVAKEFCASRVDERGVVILSEFAGAASQLRNGALLVNPYDTEQVASAIYQAYNMRPADIQHRMRRMRQRVREEDVFRWCDQFFAHSHLIAAGGKLPMTTNTPKISMAAAGDQL